MKTSAPAFALGGIVLAFAISLYSSFLFVRNEATVLRNAISWETHTQDVLFEAEHVLAALEDAQTGQRGYLITTRRDFLEPCRRPV